MKNISFDKIAILTAGLLLFALLCNLGLNPLYLEEPRRGIIAMEMLYNKNLWVPTEFGIYYCRKPPLWNWVLIGSAKAGGWFSEFGMRIGAVLSFAGIGWVIFRSGRKYINKTFGVFSAFFFLVSIDLLFHFSMLAEIDIFYSLITFSAFICFFHFYQKEQILRMFMTTYGLMALGMLTKGAPSLAFIIMTIPVYLFYKKDFRRLLSWQHVSGILFFTLIVGAYLLKYSRFNDIGCFFHTLNEEVADRTLISEKSQRLDRHLMKFFPELLKNLFPAIILIIFIIRKNFWEEIRKNKLIEFSFIILLSNILLYIISPGSRQRYIYMLYPLMINVLVYFYLISKDRMPARKRILDSMIIFLVFLSMIVCLSIPFIPRLEIIRHRVPVSVISALLAGAILYISVKYEPYRLWTLIWSVILLRIVFDFIILPYRSIDDQALTDKQDAMNIVAITGKTPLHIYKDVFSRTTVFYLERETKRVIDLTNTMNTGDFYIVSAENALTKDYIEFYRFTSKGRRFILVKKEK